ncbi:hypothetical protein L210DRAFT_3507041 [Boletus edulis BED1]|uniref:Uncharacterized protein n=1 Tax=Boletus edulis BED1 TaxID=1328754 RepID=A0AAD4BKF2_BOLED|nr:hypothetical protein L210DRAFT_3507041 [Boletus edulis BED1]
MSSLRTSRTTLTHAILTAIHPSIAHNTHFPFPVPLPSELHLMIRTHLRVHIAHAHLDSLHASLSSSLSALCDDCKSYYAHVSGPHVADWPVVRAGRGCRCTAIGLPPRPPSRKTVNPCLDHDPPPRPPVGDREPPAYFLAHVRHILATYASMDPSFPYADMPVASNADLDTLVSRVLYTFGWTAIPTTSHRNWEFDNDVLIVPSSTSSADDIPPIPLDALQIHLDLPIHDDILARSPLHPTKVTYFPPLPPPTTIGMSYSLCLWFSLTDVFAVTRYSLDPLSTSLVSGLLLLAVVSPLAIAYALHISA